MPFRIRWNSLRTLIVAWSFVPTAIILLAVALVTYRAYQAVTEDLVIERNQELTRLEAGNLSAELDQFGALLTDISRTANIYNGEPAMQQHALAAVSNRLAVFDGGVVVLDTFGTVVAALPPRPDALGQSWVSHPIFGDVLGSAQAVYSNIVNDGPGGSPVIIVAVPINDDRGQFKGALLGLFQVGDTAVSAFYGDIVKLRIEASGGAYLVDQTGRVIYHTDISRIGEDFSAQPIMQQVLAGQTGALRTQDVSGTDIVASYAPVPSTPWSLVTDERWDVLSAPTRGYRLFLLLLLVLGVLLPAVVVAVGVRRITTPIEEFTQAAQEIAEGDFSRTIGRQPVDELQALAAQFNRMSDQLRDSYATLERRVEDRTRELGALNAIALAVSQSLEIESLMCTALDKVLEVLSFPSGVMYLTQPGSGALKSVCEMGFSEAGRLELEPEGGLLAAQAVRSGSPALVRDFQQREDRQPQAINGYRSAAAVPLIAKGRVQGVLLIAGRQPRDFTQQDVDLLLSIGRQIGIAIENARLYEQAQQAAAMEERQRLARELHDAVSQTLFSSTLIAEVLPRLWERDPEEGRRRLEELRQLARGAQAEMRTLLLELRPAALVEAEMPDLLRQLGESIIGRARVPVHVKVEGTCPLPADVKVAIYRITQEALNNVAKHAGASQVWVTLTCKPGALDLEIRDDGRGFDPADVSTDRLGLGIMRERAEAIGAALTVDARPGAGTHIVVAWRGEAPSPEETPESSQ